MVIKNIPTKQLAKIIAGLVQQGVTFEAHPASLEDCWNVVLTGGY